MTIYSSMAKKNYTRFDNNVLRIHRNILKDGAKVLYVFIGGMPTGKTISYGYISKSLGYAEATIIKYINQLKELDLLYMDRRGIRDYHCFIGSTHLAASNVKEYWKELSEADALEPLTLEDLKDIRGEYIDKAENSWLSRKK